MHACACACGMHRPDRRTQCTCICVQAMRTIPQVLHPGRAMRADLFCAFVVNTPVDVVVIIIARVRSFDTKRSTGGGGSGGGGGPGQHRARSEMAISVWSFCMSARAPVDTHAGKRSGVRVRVLVICSHSKFVYEKYESPE